MPTGSFGAVGMLNAGGGTYRIFRLDAVEGAVRLPFSLKILLENLLRNEDGHLVMAAQIEALARWDPTAEPLVLRPCNGRARRRGDHAVEPVPTRTAHTKDGISHRLQRPPC